MHRIDAVCDTCGTVFYSGITIGGSGNTIKGGKSGPCPNCGGWGSQRAAQTDADGRLTYLDEMYRTVRDLPLEREQLRVLYGVLEEAQNHGKTLKQIADDVRAQIPEAEPLARFIASKRARDFLVLTTSVIVFIAALMQIIDIVVGWNGTLPQRLPSNTIDEIVTMIAREADSAPVITPTPLPASPTPTKTARQFTPNAVRKAARRASRACRQCGSGKRFSECCGKGVVK